jgi:hypothetical protein
MTNEMRVTCVQHNSLYFFYIYLGDRQCVFVYFVAFYWEKKTFIHSAGLVPVARKS